MIEYGTLKLIWWLFILVLFMVFFVFGGRDFGVCILLPWVGKNDDERRVLINSIGPTWEGNQVWFITAGGAMFAAWPIVYATAFSGLYYALLLVLFSLILRPPGFDFRSKLASPIWRSTWDWALFISGFVPALVFGIGLGNLLLGVPFSLNEILQSQYEGSFFQLLNPFSIAMGLAAVSLLALQGGVYLQKKLMDEFLPRLKKINLILGSVFILLFVLIGLWITFRLQGYHIQSVMDINASLNPNAKEVLIGKNWLHNFDYFPVLWALPVMTLLTVLFAMMCSLKNHTTTAVLMCSLAIVFGLATVSLTLFPFILPSSSHPNHSLTVWDATSSHLTLQYMFYVAVVFLPIILSYTFWVFRVLTGKIKTSEMLKQTESY